MASTYQFECERLKPLVTTYINSNFDFEAIPQHMRKTMRVCVQENIVCMWVSDGFHFIEAVFTKDAVNEFRKTYQHVKFS